MKKNNKKVYSSDSEEIMNMGKILLGIILSLGLVYLVFGIMSGEIKLKEEIKEVEINYEEVLGSTIASIKEESYYLLLYNFKDYDFSRAIDIGNYRSKKVYKVDLGKSFNSQYMVTDQKDVNLKDISSLKVLNPTLIKVNNKKIVNSVLGENEIIKELLKEVS